MADTYIWESRHGGIMYHGSVPVDTGAIAVGDTVRLNTEDHEFDVVVETLDDDGELGGDVIRIGRKPSIEADGIKRGDYVTFSEEHIFEVTRRGD